MKTGKTFNYVSCFGASIVNRINYYTLCLTKNGVAMMMLKVYITWFFLKVVRVDAENESVRVIAAYHLY